MRRGLCFCKGSYQSHPQGNDCTGALSAIAVSSGGRLQKQPPVQSPELEKNMPNRLRLKQEQIDLRGAWTVVRGCVRGLAPCAETVRRACDYLQQHAGLNESSPSVQLLEHWSRGIPADPRLHERAAAEVDGLLSMAKARLLQSAT